jgi:hypothetical protein
LPGRKEKEARSGFRCRGLFSNHPSLPISRGRVRRNLPNAEERVKENLMFLKVIFIFREAFDCEEAESMSCGFAQVLL